VFYESHKPPVSLTILVESNAEEICLNKLDIEVIYLDELNIEDKSDIEDESDIEDKSDIENESDAQ
ncbi:4248_t:CDS:2, partial [Racocetra fulgida]